MSLLSCCEKADGTKYRHGPCGCPSVDVDCESEGIVASLCGWEEIDKDGYTPSSPPVKYLVMTRTVDGETYTTFGSGPCSGQRSYESITAGEQVFTVNVEDCSLSDSGDVINDTKLWSCSTGSRVLITDLTTNQNISAPSYTTWYFGSNWVPSSNISAESGYSLPQDEFSEIRTLSVADTETDAIARQTPSVGTSCSSLWETRSTGYSFTKRTSEYTLNMSNLRDGKGYRVKPAIRRRTAVIGSYGSWEDVTTSWASFTPSGTTHSIGPTALTHSQGYEYEITGAEVEPT